MDSGKINSAMPKIIDKRCFKNPISGIIPHFLTYTLLVCICANHVFTVTAHTL